MSSGVAVLTSPDLPWSLTVLNPITENGLLMGSQATVRDCSTCMLGIAVYYTRDILPNILYNCSGYHRFGIKPPYPLLISKIAGWYGVFAISNYNSRGVWLKILGNKVTLRHFAIIAGPVSNEMQWILSRPDEIGSFSRINTQSPSTTVVRIFTAFLQQATN